jgi:hypothetical protein
MQVDWLTILDSIISRPFDTLPELLEPVGFRRKATPTTCPMSTALRIGVDPDFVKRILRILGRDDRNYADLISKSCH